MRAENPVFQASIPLIGRGWFVTRYDDVVTVAKDDRFSRDIQPSVRWLPGLVRVPLTRQMLSQDPPDHTRLRKLVSQAFTPRRIERLRDRVQMVCDERLEAASRRAPFDLVRDYALPIPLTVISELLGIPKTSASVSIAWPRAPSRSASLPASSTSRWRSRTSG